MQQTIQRYLGDAAPCARLDHGPSVDGDLILPADDLGRAGDADLPARLRQLEVRSSEREVVPLDPLEGTGPQHVQVADRGLVRHVEPQLLAGLFARRLHVALNARAGPRAVRVEELRDADRAGRRPHRLQAERALGAVAIYRLGAARSRYLRSQPGLRGPHRLPAGRDRPVGRREIEIRRHRLARRRRQTEPPPHGRGLAVEQLRLGHHSPVRMGADGPRRRQVERQPAVAPEVDRQAAGVFACEDPLHVEGHPPAEPAHVGIEVEARQQASVDLTTTPV